MKREKNSLLYIVFALVVFLMIMWFPMSIYFTQVSADELCRNNGYNGWIGNTNYGKGNGAFLPWEIKVLKAECYVKPVCETCVSVTRGGEK